MTYTPPEIHDDPIHDSALNAANLKSWLSTVATYADQLIAALGGGFKIDWQPNTAYRAGDLVLQDGQLYYAIADLTSDDVFNPDNWAQVVTGTAGLSADLLGQPGGIATLGPDGTLNAAQRPVGLTPAVVKDWGVEGDLATSTGASGPELMTDATATGIVARVGTPSGGLPIIVDVKADGTTLFSNPATRPTIPPGQKSSGLVVPGVTALLAGQELTVDIVQVGGDPGTGTGSPTFVSQTSEPGQTSVTAATVNMPAGIAIGDVDLLEISSTVNVTITPPAGWTPLDSAPASAFKFFYSFVRVHDGNNGPFTFTLSAASNVGATHTVYTGVDPDTPLAAHSSQAFTTGVGPITPSQLPGVADGGTIVYSVNLGSGRGLSTPSGYTPILGFNGTTGTSRFRHLADKVQNGAGPSDQASFTIGGTGAYSAVLRYALNPKPPAAPGTFPPGADLTVSLRYLEG